MACGFCDPAQSPFTDVHCWAVERMSAMQLISQLLAKIAEMIHVPREEQIKLLFFVFSFLVCRGTELMIVSITP